MLSAPRIEAPGQFFRARCSSAGLDQVHSQHTPAPCAALFQRGADQSPLRGSRQKSGRAGCYPRVRSAVRWIKLGRGASEHGDSLMMSCGIDRLFKMAAGATLPSRTRFRAVGRLAPAHSLPCARQSHHRPTAHPGNRYRSANPSPDSGGFGVIRTRRMRREHHVGTECPPGCFLLLRA